ncbi:hypothetical protein Y032_0002g806 [Ancylostoma ceylanicum]|uniref:Uncharacterized protein n=1 Tax=Ancylostoma ceylanicum TaxID=53326 RepID=A0A016W1C2_9BILA|nr:hypothetical protein Y032_0002g806 [Ancylostoma ceylanicum]
MKLRYNVRLTETAVATPVSRSTAPLDGIQKEFCSKRSSNDVFRILMHALTLICSMLLLEEEEEDILV